MRRLTTIFSHYAPAFCSMKKVGSSMYVPQLPQFKINPQALRPASRKDKDVLIDDMNQFTSLKRSHKEIPQCRYYAVEHRNRIYHVFNAYAYPMGRMINHIATAIRGKNSPLYKNSVANVKNGDICVIVNAVDPLFTGKKLKFKQLKYHTNFVGHLKTFSYRSILNKKPQLLYFYLLRKAMPKNKLSEHYMANLKIYRGPNHDIKGLPQFLPPKSMKSPLAHMNLQNLIKQSEEIKIISESQKGIAEKHFGRKFEYLEHQKPENTLETDQNLEDEPKKRQVAKYTQVQVMKLIRRQKKIIQRYKTVRAPYKRNRTKNVDFEFFFDEKKAKKSPYYAELADEDMEEEDDYKIDDPLFRKGWDKDQ